MADRIAEVVTEQFIKRAEVFMAAASAGNYLELEDGMLAYQAIYRNSLDFSAELEGKLEALWVGIIAKRIRAEMFKL